MYGKWPPPLIIMFGLPNDSSVIAKSFGVIYQLYYLLVFSTNNKTGKWKILCLFQEEFIMFLIGKESSEKRVEA
jgi:Zn-dependent peptidase ImmA (M78 family)